MSARHRVLTYVAVGIGGSLGAGLRIAWMSAGQGDASMSLLAVNGLGCLLIGFIWRFSERGRRRLLPSWLSIALMSGLCGALTSYSTAIAIVLAGMSDWGWLSAVTLLAASAACWLLAVGAGMALGHVVNPTLKPSP